MSVPVDVSLDDLGGWPTLIGELLDRNHLTAQQARVAMSTVLSGDATPAQLIGFVIALRAKGETSEEIGGLLDAVLSAATLVELAPELHERAIDIVGTGGDRSHSINVSTISAFVIAGAGVPVCKHGARAASSKCGAADLLEALGVQVELGPQGVRACVEESGIGFCLAARYHPTFRFAAPSRREIGVPTVFNLLGPMANPARVTRQLIGVANASFARRMVDTLRDHGSVSSWVVSSPGLDELSTTAASTALILRNGEITKATVDAAELGLSRARPEDLVGGDPAHNAACARAVLDGEAGAHRDIVLLNSAAGLVVAGVADALADGLVLAAESIDSGRAAASLALLANVSQRLARAESQSQP
jgi:anthranilate phosphoribosyltransferase